MFSGRLQFMLIRQGFEAQTWATTSAAFSLKMKILITLCIIQHSSTITAEDIHAHPEQFDEDEEETEKKYRSSTSFYTKKTKPS